MRLSIHVLQTLRELDTRFHHSNIHAEEMHFHRQRKIHTPKIINWLTKQPANQYCVQRCDMWWKHRKLTKCYRRLSP